MFYDTHILLECIPLYAQMMINSLLDAILLLYAQMIINSLLDATLLLYDTIQSTDLFWLVLVQLKVLPQEYKRFIYTFCVMKVEI